MRVRIATSIVMAAALVAALAATSFGSAATTGTLRVSEQLKSSNTMYIEGAYEYVTIRKTGTRELVLRRRFDLGKIKLARRLAPGSYRLASWTQSCSGNCGHLDPPAYACGRTIRIKAGATLRAVVVSQVGKTCRIAIR